MSSDREFLEQLLYRWIMQHNDPVGDDDNLYQDTWNFLGLDEQETLERHKAFWLTSAQRRK